MSDMPLWLAILRGVTLLLQLTAIGLGGLVVVRRIVDIIGADTPEGRATSILAMLVGVTFITIIAIGIAGVTQRVAAATDFEYRDWANPVVAVLVIGTLIFSLYIEPYWSPVHRADRKEKQ